jgi:uncharacterized protein (DUF362 family)
VITTRLDKGNLVLCVLLALAGVGVVAAEGYLGKIDLGFALFAGVIFAGASISSLWVIPRRRWYALVMVAGLAGLCTQWVGTHAGIFRYTNAHQSYAFVYFAFAMGSLFIFGLSTVLVNWVLPHMLHRRIASLGLLLLCAGLLVTGGLGRGAGPIFVVYYAALTLFAVVFAGVARAQTVIAVALSAMLFGALAETLGATSNLWQFEGTAAANLPPLWLVVVSWPLESLLHFGLSALLVRGGADVPVLRRHERKMFDLLPQHPMATHAAGDAVVIRRVAPGQPGAPGPTPADVPGNVNKRGLLDQVLEATGFFNILEQALERSGKARADFLVAVKPNFMFMYSLRDRSTFTDPELVEHLIDRIVERGFTRVALCEAQSCYGNEYEKREVAHVARHVGYREQNYRIADLTLEKEPFVFAPPLGRHVVGRTWRDADFRISFAKNKTHTWAAYTLTLKNIYGTLPMQDKLLEYHNRREIYAPTIDQLIAFPVHFGLIDAVLSADGPFGIFADRTPVPTHTILGGQNLVALDWVGASLMGLDPMVSRYMQLAVQAFGRPQPHIDGDATPYSPWRNVPEELMTYFDAMEELYGFTNLAFHLMNDMDAEFPRRPHGTLYLLARAVLEPLRRLIYVSPIETRDGTKGLPRPFHVEQQRTAGPE